MKTYSISQLARSFGLARSTLLYYERIGLLKANGRTASGYRRYSREEHARLERICVFRGAGLPLSDVKKMLDSEVAPSVTILEKRVGELEEQIHFLRGQQHTIIAMLKEMTNKVHTPIVDKDTWVKMLDAAGLDEAARARWHAEFEDRAPAAHHDFLLSLGIPEKEARTIRDWARSGLKDIHSS